MSKKINFTKLKNHNKESKVSSSKQTTISKFFTSKNVDAFDRMKTAVEAKKPKLSSVIESEDVEILPQTRKLSSNVQSKLKSYSYDAEFVEKIEDNNEENKQTILKDAISPENDEKTIELKNNNSTVERKTSKVKDKDNINYTPLENQFLEIKNKYKDTILFVECGYKYRLFAQDAQIAAKELNICCNTKFNLSSASIPCHRLFVHVRRLVAKGFKVGVVKQMETAAIKSAGENKNTPFVRKVTAIYTKATLIGENVDLKRDQDMDDYSEAPFLFCLCESDIDCKICRIGVMAVRPVTGEILYDEFVDNYSRHQLENYLFRLNPSEIIIPDNQLTVSTSRFIDYYKSVSCDEIRIEKYALTEFDQVNALCRINKFYSECSKELLSKILDLPHNVIRCLSVIIKYLSEFRLEKILLNDSYVKFENREFLNLSATSIRNLEIFNNLSNGKSFGSLFWAMNHTNTAFGGRLLRKWISCPLQNLREIEMRQEITTEIVESSSRIFNDLKSLLYKMPDLERQLTAVYHCNCSTATFYSLLKSFSEVSSKLNSVKNNINEEIKYQPLKKILFELCLAFDGTWKEYFSNLNETASVEGDKTKLFVDVSFYPDLISCQEKIKQALEKLKDHRSFICKILRLPGFNYTTIAGQEFLIEVKNSYLGAVPKDWTKINATKTSVRFRSPEVEKLYREVIYLREELVVVSNEAWMSYLNDFNQHYFKFSTAIKQLAALDCYFSFAYLANQQDYCRPLFVEHSNVLHIEQGRHPILSLLQPEGKQFIPNDTHIDEENRCVLISGPNMGGKSCYLRQVCLIVLMAQIGSYIPAKAAILSVVDGIYTRMGASDDLMKNRSTFFVELVEASEVLASATSKSLVVFDELGRGTSTHDGTAIAHATLHHLVNQIKCFTLFVTHYNTIVTQFKQLEPPKTCNFHVGFEAEVRNDDENDAEVIFLYELMEGVCTESFGLNVAKMAGVCSKVLNNASLRAGRIKKLAEDRKKLHDDFVEAWTNLSKS